jgi:hypothetical protein
LDRLLQARHALWGNPERSLGLIVTRIAAIEADGNCMRSLVKTEIGIWVGYYSSFMIGEVIGNLPVVKTLLVF